MPDVIDVSRLEFRKDGTSIYRPPGEERFVTKEHLDHEQHLVDVALMPVRQRVTAGQADAALAGTDLDFSQLQARQGPADLRAAHQLPRRPGRDRQDARDGRVRQGLDGARRRAGARPDGQH